MIYLRKAKVNHLIYQHPNFDLDKAVEAKEMYGNIYCGHSTFFWEKGRAANVGDIISCEVCCQYFIKATDRPWIVKKRKSAEHAALGIDLEFKAHTNHLNDISLFYPVAVRVTD